MKKKTKKQLEMNRLQSTKVLKVQSPITKNESKLSDANGKKDLQTQYDCSNKFDENKLGNNPISEFSAESSELHLAQSN